MANYVYFFMYWYKYMIIFAIVLLAQLSYFYKKKNKVLAYLLPVLFLLVALLGSINIVKVPVSYVHEVGIDYAVSYADKWKTDYIKTILACLKTAWVHLIGTAILITVTVKKRKNTNNKSIEKKTDNISEDVLAE